jgi:opacity protein-like surface antigen
MRGLILSLAALVAAPSLAASFEPGVYINIDTARASVSSKYVESNSDISIGGRIGYQYTPNFGFDVYARSLSLNPLREIYTEAGYYPDRHYGIAVQGTAPLNERFSLYGRAGIGRTTLHATRASMDDKDETDGMAGLGVSYHFSPRWSLNVEGSYLTRSEVKLISIGGRFQF